MLTSEYEMEFWTPDSLEICELIEDLKELEFSDKKVSLLRNSELTIDSVL